jgi:Acyl-CoA reductase (LuxC)
MLDGFYFPPGFTPSEPVEWVTDSLPDGGQIRQANVTPVLLGELCSYLSRTGRDILRRIPIRRIIEILDLAAEEWLTERAPDFHEVISGMQSATGLSLPMTRESLRKEQLSSRAEQMCQALANELGDPGMLDGFVTRSDGCAAVRALGPALTFCVLPGNIPGLSHLSFMRSLLVKSSCLGKTASGEAIYAAAYCRTLERIDAGVAECVAALNWPGGNVTLEAEVFKRAEAVIAYGTAATCEDIARRVDSETRVILHGHKLGFAMIGSDSLNDEHLADLAENLAYDVAMFDQQACLSPHWIFLENGGSVVPEKFAEALADALRTLEKKLPRGEATTEETVAFSRTWEDAELASTLGEPVSLHSQRGVDKFLVAIDGRMPPRPGSQGRAIRIVPVDKLEDVPGLLADYKGYFQNAAILTNKERLFELAETLADLGVCRICEPGRMATPTMMWHHDGLPCLEALVRYCDIEGYDSLFKK